MTKNKMVWVLLVIYVVLLAVVVVWSSQTNIICWDGFEVDEPLLMELCGITEEEYLSLDFKTEDCPEASEALYMVGGCETDWSAVFWFGVVFSVVYLAVVGLFLGVRRLLR